MNARYRAALILRDCLGLTFQQVGDLLGVTSVRANQMYGQACYLQEIAAGFLDSPREFYEYERWGDRKQPRRPFFGHSHPGLVE